MKNICIKNSALNRYLLSIITLVMVILPSLSFADEVGSFSRVEGRVDILKAGAAAAVPVKPGDSVSMGDIVRTKSDGKAEITFRDDTTIKLAPETRMKIDEYAFNPDNSRNKGVVGLLRGKVRAVVSKTRAGIIPIAIGASSFNINTPTAVAGVRGTDFFVFHDRGVTGVIFREGQGFVYNTNMPDKIVNIAEGQITFVKPDIPPLPPRPATNVEMVQHSRDTAAVEKPKEEKPAEEKPPVEEAKVEEKAPVDIASTAVTTEAMTLTTTETVTDGGKAFFYTSPGDIIGNVETAEAEATTGRTVTETTTLQPVTEAVPETLKPASVHLTVDFK